MEGRKRPLVCGVDTRVVLDQEGGDVHVLDGGEEVEVKRRMEEAVKDTERSKGGDERGRRRRDVKGNGEGR